MFKMQKIILWGLLLVAPASATDFSWQQLNGPIGGRISAQAIHANGGHFALFDNAVYVSTDNAVSWQVVFNNALSFQIGRDGVIYVQGVDGLYYSQSGLSGWNKFPNTLYNLDLSRMAVSGNGDLYFADDANLYVSTDRAVSWQVENYNFENSAKYVKIAATGDIYVFGANRLFKHTIDGGWELILEAANFIQELLITSEDQIFVAVGDENTGALFTSSNSGATWNSTSLPYAKKLFESPQGWLLGAGGTADYPTLENSFISLNGGNLWSPLNVNGPIYNFAVSSQGEIFLGSDGILISTDSGNTFQPLAPARAHVYAIAATHDEKLIAVTGTDASFWRFWRSVNGGQTWYEIDKQNRLGDPAAFSTLKSVAQDQIWLVMGYQTDADAAIDKNVIYETTDGGLSWKAVREINAEKVSIDFDKTTGICYAWAEGAKYFDRSEDGGETWEPIPTPFAFGKLLAASHGLVYGYANNQQQVIDQLYYSFESGEPGSWHVINAPAGDGTSHVFADHMGLLFKLISKEQDGIFTLNHIFRSTNYGQDWEDVLPEDGPALVGSSRPAEISMDSIGGLYLWSSDHVFLSKDTGLTWQEIYTTGSDLSSVQCFLADAGENLYVGHVSNSIRKTKKDGYRFLPAPFDGLEFPVAQTYGIVWVDYNVDGKEDVFVVNDGVNFLYKNLGDGLFRRITNGDIATDYEPSRGASWADYNNDGYPDCYVTNLNAQNSLYKNLGDGTFKKITSGNIVEDVGEFRNCAWIDANNDGHLDIYLANLNGENILYINDGTNHFNKSSAEAIGDTDDVTYGIGWCDFDNDGDLDVYLANREEDKLYEQKGDQFFQLVPENRMPLNSGVAVGCSWGDYDNDGWMDSFVANADQENVLYHNRGDGSFAKAYPQGIATDTGVSKGSAWADYDRDGDLDLFVANNGSHFFYTNNGDGTFDPNAVEEFIYYGGNSLSAAWGDRDNDGDVDLMLASYDLQTLSYENKVVGGNWLKVKCIGTMAVEDENVKDKTNRSAVGTKIRLRAVIDGKTVWQTRHVVTQTGHGGQNSIVQHFGVGDAAQIDSLIVYWPSGKVQRLDNLGVNRRMTVLEAGDTAVTEKKGDSIPAHFSLEKNYPNPFNPQTTLQYNVAKTAFVKIDVYDARGRFVRTLRRENHAPGFYTVEWDGRFQDGVEAASGLYFALMTSDNFSAITKMTLLR